MYMRLWWKDARQFWPILAFLVLVAGGTQLGMDMLVGPETRGKLLVPMAMGWACLYAFAAGAAAFAGEREAGTLAFLDRLPAQRRVVWTGKVSFAVVTTAALAAILVAVAAIDAPPQPGSHWGMPDGEAMLTLGTVIAQALAWGLLCSAILPSALLAAVAAIGLTTLSRLVTLDLWFGYHPTDRLTRDLTLAGAALTASLIVFTRGRRDRRLPSLRLPFEMRLRSPVEVSWRGRPRAVAGRSRAPIAAKAAPVEPATHSSTMAPAPRASTMATARPVIPAAAQMADRPRPRSRTAELRSLIWQTLREGQPTWRFLAVIGLICPTMIMDGAHLDPIFLLVWYGIITLGAGVSVFGLENRRHTHRFLVHHGARPGLVWLAKLSTWCFGLAVIWAPLIYALANGPRPFYGRFPEGETAFALFGLHLPMIFSIAVLSGMAIPRGITAGVVAMVVSLLLAAAQSGLLMVGMLPHWGLAVLPLVFLAVAWGWRADWLLDRPAPGRWVRLGLGLSGLLAASFGGYTGWRAWSVPDVGPIAMPSDWVVASARLPDNFNAAPLYREAATRLERVRAEGKGQIETLPGPSSGLLVDVQQSIVDLDQNREIADMIRRATARPECQFFNPARITLRSRLDLPAMRELGNSVAAHALRAMNRGDLAGAWDDITLIFRMARHVRQGATLTQALASLALERQALGLALRWANAPGQTPDRLRTALAAYRALPAMTPAAEVVRAEGLLAERTIDLPIEDLRDLLAEMNGPNRAVTTEELLRLDLISTPWERARARRVNRRITEDAARLMLLEPRQRPAGRRGLVDDGTIAQGGNFSLVSLLHPNLDSYEPEEDRAEVERRALALLMAAREWSLRHDGQFPERLEQLTPDVLPALPLDPYSGRPFGYMTFTQAEDLNPAAAWPQPRWPAGSRLIYSVGPDGGDNRGIPESPFRSSAADIDFPVLPATSETEGR